jgi:hypothetical protein
MLYPLIHMSLHQWADAGWVVVTEAAVQARKATQENRWIYFILICEIAPRIRGAQVAGALIVK